MGLSSYGYQKQEDAKWRAAQATPPPDPEMETPADEAGVTEGAKRTTDAADTSTAEMAANTRVPSAPSELRRHKAWVLWKLEPGESKPRKVPYYADGRKRHGEQGSPADLTALASYEAVAGAFRRGGYDGVGFCTLPQWGVTALDFDDVITDGQIHQDVQSLIGDTYSEISPSGKGVRAFFKGSLADGKDNGGSPQVEFFHTKGFVTVTGNATEVCKSLGMQDTVAPLSMEIFDLHQERFGSATPATGEPKAPDPRVTIEIATAMLDAVAPDPEYQSWLNIGMALHHQFGADGFALWNTWSAKGTKYPGERELRQKWRSFRGDGLTIATLKKMARDAGWQEDCSQEFSPIVSAADAPPPLPGFSRTNKGQAEATINNLLMALPRVDLLGQQIGFDTFRDQVMLAPPDIDDQWRQLTDDDYTALRAKLEQQTGRVTFKPIPKELLRDAVSLISKRNQFDSGIEWIESLIWDGVPRIEQFLPRYMGAEDTAYTRAVSAYLWTALAGRLLVPGIKADMVPVAVGPQGARKSSAAAAIVPDPEFFTELNLAEPDKERAYLIRGKLICELAELKGLRSSESEHIKAAITRTHEEWRLPYTTVTVRYARRCIFFGTSNDEEFLADDTGHRRWLPFRVQECNPDAIATDRAQLWAEARERFQREGVIWEPAERLARGEHEHFLVTDTWGDTVSGWLDQLGPNGAANRTIRPLTSEVVLRLALGFDSKQMEQRHKRRLAGVMKSIGFVQKSPKIAGKTIKVWEDGRVPF